MLLKPLNIVPVDELKTGVKLVLAFPNNGYDDDKEKAKILIEQHGENPIFTLKFADIGGSYSSVYFEEIVGSYNSVHFALASELENRKPAKRYKVYKHISQSHVAEVIAESEEDAIAMADDWLTNWNNVLGSYDCEMEVEVIDEE